jgi:hypothetical protein
MKLLLKILGINLLAFLAYATLIEFVTNDDWEGFAQVFYYLFLIGLQILVNLILTARAAILKKPDWKSYLAGLILTLVIAASVFLILD